MKMMPTLCVATLGALLSGCATNSRGLVSPMTSSAEYEAKEPIMTSLFPSDQAVLGDEAVRRILESKLELPARAKLALMKFPDGEGSRHYGRYYWHDEEYLKLQQSQVDALAQALAASEQIAAVMPLPSLMTPSRVS